MPLPVLQQHVYFPNQRARVVVNRQVGQRPMQRHRHDFKELVVVLSGEGLHNLNGRRHRIGRGDVLFIDENSSHAYERTSGLNLVNLLVNREALARMEPDLAELPGYPLLLGGGQAALPGLHNWMRLDDGELEQVAGWIDRMEAEIAGGTGAGYIVAEAYLKLILAVVLRRIERQVPAHARPDAFKATLSWIEAHLGEPLQVPALARRAGMSERTFQRRFREATGTSPADYILKARLRKAAGLLKGSRKVSCRETAARCGFRDANYFSTSFRRVYGHSPSRHANQQ